MRAEHLRPGSAGSATGQSSRNGCLRKGPLASRFGALPQLGLDFILSRSVPTLGDRPNHGLAEPGHELAGVLNVNIDLITGKAEGLAIREDATMNEGLKCPLDELALRQTLKGSKQLQKLLMLLSEPDALGRASHLSPSEAVTCKTVSTVAVPVNPASSTYKRAKPARRQHGTGTTRDLVEAQTLNRTSVYCLDHPKGCYRLVGHVLLPCGGTGEARRNPCYFARLWLCKRDCEAVTRQFIEAYPPCEYDETPVIREPGMEG
jgi:hypothetical protein